MKKLIFSIACILFIAGSTHGNLLINGGFEAPWTGGDVNGQNYVYRPYGPGLGWDFADSIGIGLSKSWSAWGGKAYEGSQFVFIQMSGRAPSSVSSGDHCCPK